MPQQQLISVTAAAAKLGVSRQRVLVWIGEGRIAAIRPGRDWLIPATKCRRPPERKSGRPPSKSP